MHRSIVIQSFLGAGEEGRWHFEAGAFARAFRACSRLRQSVFERHNDAAFEAGRGVAGSAQFEPRMDFHHERLGRSVGGSVIKSGKLEMTRAIRRASSRVNPPERFVS